MHITTNMRNFITQLAMIQEIKSKLYSEKYGVIVTDDKRVVRMSDMAILKREYSHNRIVYRARGENQRIGENSLRDSLIKREVIIQDGCPF